MTKPKILITDDEKMTRDTLAKILQKKGYACVTAADPELALAALKSEDDIALLLTDYKMPGMNGVELIKAAKKLKPALGAILITAFGEIELAVAAMKEGADDFLTKPITDFDELERRIESAIKVAALDAGASLASRSAYNDCTASDSRAQGAGNGGLAAFTGSSPEMERVYALIRRIAPTTATTLITGPSGAGKELVARALHDLSPRAAKPFIAVECAAFSASLLESELFGYVPGTFTGGLKDGKKGCIESADGGTLFLDEIGEIDKATQTALLRTLETKCVRRVGGSEERPVDFRLVAATNRDLKAMVASGDFREDLYYRLNVIEIKVPALKERPGDIQLLAERFVKDFAKQYASPVRSIVPDALAALAAYAWPGNVRELRNVIERATLLATGDTLSLADLPSELATSIDTTTPLYAERPARLPDPNPTLAESEKRQILAALAEAKGNKSKAAEKLGISRRTLHRKLNEWGHPEES